MIVMRKYVSKIAIKSAYHYVVICNLNIVRITTTTLLINTFIQFPKKSSKNLAPKHNH